MEYLKEIDCQLDPQADDLTQRQLDAILALCRIPYWERMWIVQEVVLARVVIMCYGAWTVRFHALELVMVDPIFFKSFEDEENICSSSAADLYSRHTRRTTANTSGTTTRS